MSLTTITTIKAPLQATLDFVNYHLHSGVDHMYLFFDDPNDDAVSYLDSSNRLSCIRCDKNHYTQLGVGADATVQEKQKANATFAFRRAREMGFTWTTHIDSDELLYSKRPLNTCFANVSNHIDLILFPLMEAVPQQLSYTYPLREISLFKYHINHTLMKNEFRFHGIEELKYDAKRLSWKFRKKTATALKSNHCELTGSWLLGHMNSKTAVKTSANVKIIGNHMPVVHPHDTLSLAVSSEVNLLHFDCQGYSHWKDKCRSRLTGHTNFDISRLTLYRKKQLDLFRRVYEKGNEDELLKLYKQLYILSDYNRNIFKFLGLLKNIDLNKRFNSFESAD